MANIISNIQPIKPMTFSKIEENQASTGSFSSVLKDVVSEYTTLQEASDKDTTDLAVGNADNLTQIQINSMKAETALQTTVQLTSRVVSAYKEIMQTQI